MEAKLISITGLAERHRLHRQTVRERLRAAGIEPQERRANVTLFVLTDEVDAALTAADDAELEEARRRKESARARLAELRVGRAEGRLLPVEAVRGVYLGMVRNLHQRLCVHFPREAAPRLARLESAEQFGAAVTSELKALLAGVQADAENALSEVISKASVF